jgi:hypothetical protein
MDAVVVVAVVAWPGRDGGGDDGPGDADDEGCEYGVAVGLPTVEVAGGTCCDAAAAAATDAYGRFPAEGDDACEDGEGDGGTPTPLPRNDEIRLKRLNGWRCCCC